MTGAQFRAKFIKLMAPRHKLEAWATSHCNNDRPWMTDRAELVKSLQAIVETDDELQDELAAFADTWLRRGILR